MARPGPSDCPGAHAATQLWEEQGTAEAGGKLRSYQASGQMASSGPRAGRPGHCEYTPQTIPFHLSVFFNIESRTLQSRYHGAARLALHFAFIPEHCKYKHAEITALRTSKYSSPSLDTYQPVADPMCMDLLPSPQTS